MAAHQRAHRCGLDDRRHDPARSLRARRARAWTAGAPRSPPLLGPVRGEGSHRDRPPDAAAGPLPVGSRAMIERPATAALSATLWLLLVVGPLLFFALDELSQARRGGRAR